MHLSYTVPLEHGVALGMSSGDIMQSQISSSDKSDGKYPPWSARLVPEAIGTEKTHWKGSVGQWIQVCDK